MEAVLPYLILFAVAYGVARSLIKHPHKPRSSGVAGAFGVIEDIYSPAAARSRAEREANNEKVVPMPSVGPLDETKGEITIQLPLVRENGASGT
jgi:hypothetical protein